MVEIELPMTVTIPRKTKQDKVFSLNLNIYRNTHHMVLNQAKVAWKDVVKKAVGKQQILFTGPCTFTYTVYPGNNRAFDIGNVLPIVQKFTDDALIELGIITDDNFKHISRNVHRFGSVDKGNPHVVLTIEPTCIEDIQQGPL